MRTLSLAAILLTALLAAHSAAARLIVDVNANLTQDSASGELRSRGEAKLVDTDTNEVITATTLDGEHLIQHQATGANLVKIPFSTNQYLAVARANNFVVGQCYVGRVSVFRVQGLVGEDGQSTSPELCAEPPEEPPPTSGGGGGEFPTLEEDPTCEECDPELGCTCSPILVDMQGNGYHLSGAEDPVHFDIDAVGTPYRISWTARGSDDAFLALDRNGNGTIDDGSELFGNSAPQPASFDPNGFRALAVYDQPSHGGNGDGSISAEDAIFHQLLLWTDSDHDGVSQAWELASLTGSGVQSFELGYRSARRRDRHGNWFRWASSMEIDGRPRPVVDVIFVGE